jgi:hypothetical protein
LLYRKLHPIKQNPSGGMRTSRLRKLSADADALRRESPASRTLFYWPEQDSLVIIRIFMYDKEDEGSEKPWSMTCFCKKADSKHAQE